MSSPSKSPVRVVVPVGLSLLLSVPLQAQGAAKKRVAVLDFEYQTVHAYVYELFGSDVDIGRGITNLLVKELVRNGTYRVIERQALDQILAEQDFQVSGRADAGTAASIGKLLGVDVVVIGAITQFGRDDKNVAVGGGARAGPIRLGGVGRKSSKATVVIDARIVSVQTAEILAVATGKGESKRSGTQLWGAGVAGIGAGGHIDMSSSNFQSTIIGEATTAAVEGLLKEVVGAEPRIEAVKVQVAGLVADVAGSELTLNIGTSHGVRVGETYPVLRPGREIRDPATGRVIRRTTTPVGDLMITEAGDTWAVGRLSGGPAQTGDCVGSCPAEPAAPPPEPAPAPDPAPAPTPAPVAAAPAGGVVGGWTGGPFVWTPYQFRGTERFRYDVKSTEDGATQTGYYTLEIRPAAGGQYRVQVEGRLGQDSYASTVTAPTPDGGAMGMGQFMALGPLGATLFAPTWWLFMGQQWSVGDGWSTSSGGESFAVRVERTCQHAGVGGVLGVVRENNEVTLETCVAPNVALPLYVRVVDGSYSVMELTLVEYRP